MIKQIALFDDDGNLIRQVTKTGSQLKEGWIVFYKEELERLMKANFDYSVVKVYMYLCSQQTYQTLVMTPISHVARELRMSYRTAWGAVRTLEAEGYLARRCVDGVKGFLINPKVTTCGKSSLAAKNILWSLDLGKVSSSELDRAVEEQAAQATTPLEGE